MTPVAQPDPRLEGALGSALESCRQALADYRAGLLDEVELRRALFGAGLVHGQDEAWLLDLRAGRWWHYDGVSVAAGDGPPGQGVGRLHAVIDELAVPAATNEGAEG